MKTKLMLSIAAALSMSACGQAGGDQSVGSDMTLQQAVQDESRTERFVKRDSARHPVETLEFFEVAPSMTVVEIWPGGGYYTEILAPYLSEGGQLYAAHFPQNSNSDYYQRSLENFTDRVQTEAVFGNIQITEFAPLTELESDIAPPNSADRVLTFRNVHNWYMSGGEEAVRDAFEQFWRALKPDGILGVVDHRLPSGANADAMAKSGYVHQQWVIDIAEQAGFEFVEASEVNANPKDTADHPNGVWNLPPTLNVNEGDDAEIYKAIGESDRFTLKFRKPTTQR
ncbi:putative methyltransferase [Idiomarina fontislapidosi]|uniref:Methyltransferase n=1 Tax=Idiomarina fontislapidosi TaxID=263723 RepID=A0A432Y7Y3_9GAMM|nr:class I SAM-dependent methyltransferase [Idiomarina fontislapidosi]PYE32395.1 putative methyltransferase [Idiomarina fontislapidosi]RUO57098.1 methyltransferase [Idiomarina fontislapidosi]